MSSFFTIPASQRKRKRTEGVTAPASKRRNTNPKSTKPQKVVPTRPVRDESISGSESDDDGGPSGAIDAEEHGDSSGTEHEDETAAERRLRLAERYLENLKGEVDEVGFDAADIDRDLIAERLKEDVAETKGRLYRRIASELSFQRASPTQFRADTLTTTAIATCPPFVYTVSKDITLIKWELCTPISTQGKPTKKPQSRKRPRQVAYTKGNKNKAHDNAYQGHVDQILTVAASADGRFVVTGGRDRRMIVWNATDLTPLRVFTQHRDAVTGLAFRRGTNQLYSSAKDRTIKTWSLDELAYVETLFGHQDEVVDVAALAQERCISVGARDRTARLWKVVEETQLVFRGGGGEKKAKDPTTPTYAEGSIDRVAMIDEEMFVTGSDNGSVSLWTLHKKKPIFTVPLAHGLDPPLRPDEASADQNPDPVVPSPPQPRWITALATIPYSDVILSGSWDGHVRAWKVSEDKRRIEALGAVGVPRDPAPVANSVNGHHTNGDHKARESPLMQAAEAGSAEQAVVRGVINDLSVFERGERGKDGICIVAAVGTEHRLGRWKKMKGKNGAVVFEVGRAPPAASVEVEEDGKEIEGSRHSVHY